MSSVKKGMLVFYAILAVLAVTQSDLAVGQWSLYLLGILALAHLVEVGVFFKLCRDAGGSLPGHILQVFLFGIVHARELQQAGNSA